MAQEGATEAWFGLPYLFCEVWNTKEQQGIIAPPELSPLAWHNSLQGPDGVVDSCSGDTQVYYGLPHLFEVRDTDEHGTKHVAPPTPPSLAHHTDSNQGTDGLGGQAEFQGASSRASESSCKKNSKSKTCLFNESELPETANPSQS